ncbi:MAG TPA: response regulator transcription factor [Acidobacteriaceae bacterium]|nr:response regulator transcription factor [Acidobacteriaceae bacterium]
MSAKIRILLVDDHSLFRESLSRLLQTESDFHIAGNCASATAALALPDLKDVDVVLLDYDLGEEEGTRFLEQAPGYGFSGRILLVTAGMPDTVMLRALQSGSSGVFLKHSPPGHLVDAIRKVVAGEMWLDPGVARSILAAATGTNAPKRSARELTEREQAVLKGVFEGLTNKEIGARLAVSESSVKAVLQQLFEKTGVRTRSQLVRIALEKHSREWLTGPA